MNLGPSVTQAARRVVGEHDHLRRLLAQVDAAFGRSHPCAGSGPDVVAARLDALRGPLRAHFDEQERAGLLDRIHARTPERGPVCAQLRAEHESLLRHLDGLRGASPVERRGPLWMREVRRFMEDLARHETCEAELMREAMGPKVELD